MTDLAKLAKILFLIYFAGKFGLLTLLFLPNGKVQKILNDVNNIQRVLQESDFVGRGPESQQQLKGKPCYVNKLDYVKVEFDICVRVKVVQ